MEALTAGEASPALAELSAAVEKYLAEVEATVALASDADLLAELREVERLRRRLASADHVPIAELAARGLPRRLAAPTVGVLLQRMLRSVLPPGSPPTLRKRRHPKLAVPRCRLGRDHDGRHLRMDHLRMDHQRMDDHLRPLLRRRWLLWSRSWRRDGRGERLSRGGASSSAHRR